MNTGQRTKSQLREYLDSRGIRYSWVAERLEITPSHMTRLMDGERPVTRALARKLAELFGEPIGTFLGDAE